MDFTFFLLVTAFCCASGFFLRMYFAKERWELNPQISFMLVLKGVWWNFKSVMFEELIFRGAVLYILIKSIGATRAIIISAIAFGIYHWFSHEVIGNPSQMAITFLVTGTMGLVYAYAYAKTCSLYTPVAIHFGWNFTKGFLFSEGPIGNGILTEVKPIPVVNVSYFIYVLVVFVPLLSALLINFFLVRRKQQATFPENRAAKL